MLLTIVANRAVVELIDPTEATNSSRRFARLTNDISGFANHGLQIGVLRRQGCHKFVEVGDEVTENLVGARQGFRKR